MMTLKFCAEAPFGAIIEFVALALHGWVIKTKVTAQYATYFFEESPRGHEFTVTVRKLRYGNAEVFKTEVVSVLCALHFLGANSLEASGFSKNHPLVDVSTWLITQRIASLSGDGPIDERTNLKLSDLQDIWQSLAFSAQPIRLLDRDTEFTTLFPYANIIAGFYESLRHRSGCEIPLGTRKDGTITEHRVDAPDPGRDLFRRWKQTPDSSPTLVNNRIGIYLPDSYRGLDESRWRVSKMLGAAPPQHKSRVFAWADNAIFTVDEYHNTRGGVPIPLIFECRYDDMYLTADRELRFKVEAV